MTEKRIRFRFYVNQTLVHRGDMTLEEADRAQTVGEGMLREGDRWVMIFEDLTGAKEPWVYGNDDVFAPKIVRDLFPGRKMPEGEMGWQKRHGVRIPPDAGLHDIDYGVTRA